MAISSSFLSWVGEMQTNYWPGLENKNYKFYNKVRYFKIIFEIGSGVTIPNKQGSVNVCRIHCMYEDPNGRSSCHRFRAIVEIFLKPEELPLNKYIKKFNTPHEIIQQANITYRNVPIDSFRKKCVIMFAIKSEDPEDIIKMYHEKYKEPIYVCRYIKVQYDDTIEFHSAVKTAISNGYKISEDDDEIERLLTRDKTKDKQYRITALECDNEAVKLKLKRKSLCSPDKNVGASVPTVLLERLNINDNEENWSVRKPLGECTINTPTKQEIINDNQNKSRRKQNFSHKMYSKLIEDEIFVSKEQLKEDENNLNERENNKISLNKTDTLLKPNKINTPVKSPKRKLTYDNIIVINSDDENLEKKNKNDTKKKKLKKEDENEHLNEIDFLTNKMKKKLGIITPQKSHSDSPKSTPQRKRLVCLEEESDNEPSPNTYKKPTKTNNEPRNDKRKKSLRNSPRKLIVINSDEEVIVKMKTISTPKESDMSSSYESESETQDETPLKRYQSSSKKNNTPLESDKTLKENKKPPKKDPILSKPDDSPSKLINTAPNENKRRSTRISLINSTKKILPENCENSNKDIRRSSRLNLRNTPRKNLEESDDDSPVKTSVKKNEPVNKILKSVIERTPSKTKRRLDSESTPTKKHVTPKKNTPRINISCLTPEIELRTNVLTPSNNPFERARAQLNSSLRPGCLPCREKEFDDIMTFLSGKLMDNSGGCMYISGVPGTGKTATVCEIMKLLNNENKKKKNDFKFISVNALSLTEPRQVYVEIVKQMNNKSMTWDESLTYIRNFFLKGKHPLHILLIDELDKLCTRKQDVVYNLLDLPSMSKTPLVVLTIANTMDLPERLLSNKVNSRLGLTRLTFHPYKHKELIDIVKTRLSKHGGVFRNEALEFIARKVAAVSGDARRALAICGRATEIAEASGIKEITMDIVNKTLLDMASSPKVQAIKSCSGIEKMILQAVVQEVTRTGNDEVSFSNIVQLIDAMCILDSVPIPSISLLLSCCQRLNFFRLIIMQEGKFDVLNTLLLNVSSDDIHFALKDD